MGCTLFSKYVDQDSKSRIAARILAQGDSEKPIGKPEIPSFDGSKHLAEYVGPESWVLFDIIGTFYLK